MDIRTIDANALLELYANGGSINLDDYKVPVRVVRQNIIDAPTLDYAPVVRRRPGVAVVEHQVSTDPAYCEHSHPDDGFCEHSLCAYMKHRDRHGKKGRIDRGLPRCTLFNAWLEKEGWKHKRCSECKVACGAVIDKEDT